MSVKVGFTGTRRGMTDAQESTLANLLGMGDISEVHHGDCVGADDQFDTLAHALGIPVIIHPPINPKARAYCIGYARREEEKGYIARNIDIVDACDMLIAAPKEEEEIQRSGTWSTVRYGRMASKHVYIITPQGRLVIG